MGIVKRVFDYWLHYPGYNGEKPIENRDRSYLLLTAGTAFLEGASVAAGIYTATGSKYSWFAIPAVMCLRFEQGVIHADRNPERLRMLRKKYLDNRERELDE